MRRCCACVIVIPACRTSQLSENTCVKQYISHISSLQGMLKTYLMFQSNTVINEILVLIYFGMESLCTV